MISPEILKQIRKIVRSINLESKKIQKEYGISIPQLLCLNFLNEQEDLLASHKVIADFLELNSSTVTGIINRLEKKGLVARLPNRDDRRSTNIAITAAGKKLIDDAPGLLHNRLLNGLNKLEEEELLNISSSLEVLINSLGIEELEASPLLIVDDEPSE